MRRVWYVAYGSNLGMARFGCYLSGVPSPTVEMPPRDSGISPTTLVAGMPNVRARAARTTL